MMAERPKKNFHPLGWIVVFIAAGLVGVVAYYFAYMGRASEGLARCNDKKLRVGVLSSLASNRLDNHHITSS